MPWMENIQLAQVGGTFWPSLGIALLGVILLWALRPFLARRLGERAALLLAVKIDGASQETIATEGELAEIPHEQAAVEEEPTKATVPAAKALAAYAAQAGGEKTPMMSSSGAEGPITRAVEPVVPSCPLELSRRIDRIEARIRARRIGIRV